MIMSPFHNLSPGLGSSHKAVIHEPKNKKNSSKYHTKSQKGKKQRNQESKPH